MKLDGLARLAAAASPAPAEQGLHGLSALARLADLGPASPRSRLVPCPVYLFQPTQPLEGPPVDPFSYDIIVVAFSGGADSLAMVLSSSEKHVAVLMCVLSVVGIVVAVFVAVGIYRYSEGTRTRPKGNGGPMERGM
jgi:hypothetical protein